ncbi:polysaccharide biosynthesis/export family protein [Pedomonas mirosovicensis]|uniref:polysaccharide biosynthesis/export family protein n=1 Tax=Pedomonas mirosovicensis TaxID=2908641 RepID=UPI00216782A2|nr:SLBB domain-containing protein [Pedomonas mirosovicensis]MCH8685615.1 SLBB domain-containing protein [Pedomonas mirosovicensis]
MSVSSPVDDSRGASGSSDFLSGAAGLSGMTASERELRELQARQLLLENYKPSAIEEAYRERTGNKDLRQFGYDLFEAAFSQASQNGSFTGRVGGNYIVGVGDEFVVLFQGPEPRNITTRVDREGRLIIDQLPPIPAAGRRFDAVMQDIQAATRQTMLGTEAHVSLGAVRSISVVVGGEVERPGQYNLTSLSDITHALAQANGIKRTGSLRQVRIERAGRSVTVDLYGLLGIGTPPLIRLQDGDRIIVPTIGRTIAVTGSVVRQGIFEMAPGNQSLTLSQAVGFAGGALRPTGNDYSVLRIMPNGREEVIALTEQSETIQHGDVVQVLGRERFTTGKVTLSGYVNNPGVRSLTMAPTVKALLGGSANNMQMGSYLPFAVLLRRDPISSSTVFSGVNLYDVFYENQDVSLRSEDQLIVLGSKDIVFLQSPEVRSIVLGQPNPKPECVSLVNLEKLVQDSQSDRFAAVTRGSFIIDKGNKLGVGTAGGAQNRLGVSDVEKIAMDQSAFGMTDPRMQQLGRVGQQPGMAAGATAQGQSNQAYGQINQEEDPEKAKQLHDEMCPPVFEDNPAILPFLLENVVVAGGNLRRPGIYPVWGTLPINVMASIAEGLASRSDNFTVDLTRADPYNGTTNQTAIQGTMDTFAAIKVSAGDDLRFNVLQPQYEVGAVLLTGEFLRPGLYSIRKGETLSQLIERAGGLTEHAYPYGAVFTRRSVKLAQQEGFKRTAREMNTALLSMSARKNVSADALAAATSLTNDLSTMDAPGRMVVEADPTVLAAYPEADTVLEAGDAIYMPKKPNFVLAMGDVLNPGALQFAKGKTAKDYLEEAGGIQRSADEGRVFIVYPNGVAQPLKTSGWLRSSAAVVPPGSTIVVPKDIDPLYTLDIVRDVATIIGQFATALASIAVISNQ